MYSKTEELWHAISHGIGVVLGIAGFVILLIADTGKTSFSTLSILLYSISMILLYSASTLYHATNSLKWKVRFKILDHISIYFLIAGTYAPVALISLANGNGWTIFWIVWIIAALGTILKIFFTGRFDFISVVLYLATGWLIVFDFQNLLSVQSTLGITLLILGGASYTLGVLFYAVRKIPYNHLIWHVLVLAGSIFHYFFILLDVV